GNAIALKWTDDGSSQTEDNAIGCYHYEFESNIPELVITWIPPSEDLPAEFEVAQWQEDLFGEFIVRHIGTPMELPAEFEIGQDSEDLFGEFIVRQEISVDLPAEFEVRHVGTPIDLPAEFEVGQSSEDLPAEFFLLVSGSENLPGEFTVRQPSSEDLLGEFIVRHVGIPRNLLASFDGQVSLNLPGEFVVRQEISENLPGEFEVVHIGLPGGLPGEFIVRHSAILDLVAGFDGQTSANLKSEFRVRCPRRFGGNWQRKMWFDGTYYWRGRYCPTDNALKFEYIAAANLSGNIWTENAAARISAVGFTGIIADFTVRGEESGLPTTIHYSDGIDTWVAESDEASLDGWAWSAPSPVFEGTDPDWYRRVNLCANRTTPTPRLWAVAVFYDQSEGTQWVKASRQTTGGNLANWDAPANISSAINTATIYGCSARSMGDAGPLKNDIMVVYKEGAALKSK
ncbi:unnamed protein product, partial [marine sediment metagenome]